jgi:hypothetical protein
VFFTRTGPSFFPALFWYPGPALKGSNYSQHDAPAPIRSAPPVGAIGSNSAACIALDPGIPEHRKGCEIDFLEPAPHRADAECVSACAVFQFYFIIMLCTYDYSKASPAGADYFIPSPL